MNRNNNLNQSIIIHNSPPFIIVGLELYSSANIAKFQNNLTEVSNDKKLNINTIIENLFFPINTSLLNNILLG
jgi:hypothetical protein